MSHSTDVLVPYERRLDQDSLWALNEGGLHFEEKSEVFKTFRRITGRLNDLGIPYAVVGDMAHFRHGFRHYTEYVEILVTKPDLQTIRERLDGLGFLSPDSQPKQLRDAENGVRIEFVTTGDFPGNAKEQPVALPDPSEASFESDGVRFIKLPTLVELKLASGMSSFRRLRDLSDVMQLIKTLRLPLEFSGELDPYVRPRFLELWNGAQTPDPYA